MAGLIAKRLLSSQFHSSKCTQELGCHLFQLINGCSLRRHMSSFNMHLLVSTIYWMKLSVRESNIKFLDTSGLNFCTNVSAVVVEGIKESFNWVEPTQWMWCGWECFNNDKNWSVSSLPVSTVNHIICSSESRKIWWHRFNFTLSPFLFKCLCVFTHFWWPSQQQRSLSTKFIHPSQTKCDGWWIHSILPISLQNVNLLSECLEQP